MRQHRCYYPRLMAVIVEYLSEEELTTGQVAEENAKRLQVRDLHGRVQRVAPEKVLFRHSAPSIAALLAQIEPLQSAVDVGLLWAALEDDDDAPREAPALARLFFDRDDALHSSAVYRALLADRVFFRRRGRLLTRRSSTEIEQLHQMRAAEQRSATELATTQAALTACPLDAALAQRLERWLRGYPDRALEPGLASLGGDPAEQVFELLLRDGYLPPTAVLEVLRADLCEAHPPAALAQAEALELRPPSAPLSADFAIDDPDTREVDDALSIGADGTLWRIDIDIADATAYVRPGDPIDDEAARRATTVYLPTGRFYMLPERISCDQASLRAGAARPVLRTSIWLDDEATVVRSSWQRAWVVLQRRLSYEQADALLAATEAATDALTSKLQRLDALTRARRERRRTQGALLLQRHEWKLSVDRETAAVEVRTIDAASSSRRIVAELMILTNELAAQLSRERELPTIYRAQAAPTAPLPTLDPTDPLALVALRGLLTPAYLSLRPEAHWALGLGAYTQVTSPLRRYGDLVLQQQIVAHLAGEPPPYDEASLQPLLTTIERVEHAMRRLESSVTQRWALEFVARQDRALPQRAWVLAEVGGGYKVRLADSGADGLLGARAGSYRLGEELLLRVERIAPRRGTLRLVPAA
ncbi:MAG: RNB domain-containing ribonuclease [Proteobacteria bacterium]|nr:RNB domain-containing ribonuclease [Pseudomonadota bacterium]